MPQCGNRIQNFAGGLLRRPVAVSMVCAALVAGGLFAFGRLPLDLAPSVEFPALSVQTAWPGVSAETVEMMLTAPIEETGNTVFGVRGISSVSSEGFSRVSFEFQQETRMDFARLELNEKLASLFRTLPDGIGQPAIEPYIPEDFRNLHGFMSYSLAGMRPASVLRKLAQDVIAPSLRSIRGVADVAVYGGEEVEIHIELDAKKIEALGLNIHDVTSGISALEFNAPVGEFTVGSRRHIVSVRNAGLGLDELGRTPIARNAHGSPIRITDIGSVRMAAADPASFFRINGKPCVTLVIGKDPSVNTLRLSDAVAARAGELRASLPDGVELILESDKSREMRAELEALSRDAALSLLCILVVLFLFLGNVKSPVVVLSSICFSLAGTILVFWILGIGLHLLSLAGLVLGFGRLVDDSIVVLDNIQRRGYGIPSPAEITAAVGEIALPVTASTVTTIGALLPTAFLPHDLKPYFIEFSLAVGISLLMSLAVSFTLIPVVAGRLRLSPVLPVMYARAGAWGFRAYTWLLKGALSRKRTVLLFVVWLFGIPVWLLPESVSSDSIPASSYNAIFGSDWYRTARPYVNYLLGGASHLFFAKVEKGEAWATDRETYLIVRMSFPQGTDLLRYNEIARRVEAEALGFGDQIEKVTCRVESDFAFIRITIDDSLSNSGIPYVLKDRLTILAAHTGGAAIGVWGFGPGYSSGGEGAPSFAVRVLGYNYNRVKEIAQRFRERLEANPRITDVDIDRSLSGQWGIAAELVAGVDRLEAARYGVSVADVMKTIRTSIPGVLQQNRLTIGGERIPCVVKIAGYEDYSSADLERAVVTGTEGQAVRLAAVLSLREQRTPGEIFRENQSYVRWVTFEYRGPYRFGNAYIDATIRSMMLPHGYRLERAASWFTFSEADKHSLLLIAGFALIIVFMVTASLYESFRKPLLVILAVPFSLIGMFLAYYLTGTPFGRGGYAAVIFLIGIVVTNSIVLVDFLSRRCAIDGFSIEVLVSAAGERLRPILMTTLTTIGGLIPMLLFGERSSIWYSLALGTIGGLTSSMCLTVLLLPVGYRMIHRSIRFLNLRGSLRTITL